MHWCKLGTYVLCAHLKLRFTEYLQKRYFYVLSFLSSPIFSINFSNTFFCFQKSSAIPKWHPPCQVWKHGLSFLCFPPLNIHSHAMNSVCLLLKALPTFALLPFLTVPYVVHTNVLDVLALNTLFHHKSAILSYASSQFLLHFLTVAIVLAPAWVRTHWSKENTLPSGRFPASYLSFIFLPGWDNKNPWWCQLSRWCQDSINTSLPHREQLEWSIWAHQAQCNICSIFWFLTKSAGSSSLLPCGILTNS